MQTLAVVLAELAQSGHISLVENGKYLRLHEDLPDPQLSYQQEFRKFLAETQRLEAKYRRADGTSMVTNQRALQFSLDSVM